MNLLERIAAKWPTWETDSDYNPSLSLGEGSPFPTPSRLEVVFQGEAKVIGKECDHKSGERAIARRVGKQRGPEERWEEDHSSGWMNLTSYGLLLPI